MKENSIEEDIKNLSEIIELCEEEINNNDENVSAILDLTDLKSLRNLIKEYKNLKEIEENHRKENGELRERVKELEEENKKIKIEKISYLKELQDRENKIMEKDLEIIGAEEYTKASMGEIIEHYYIANEKCIPVSLIEERIEELSEDLEIMKVDAMYGRFKEYGSKLSFEKQFSYKYGMHDVLQELLEGRK